MGYDYDYYNKYMQQSLPYIRYGPFDILTFIMSAVLVAIALFSFSCALGYIADVAEEFPTRTKRVIHGLVLFALIGHCVMLVECFSFWRSILSVVTNVLYLRLLRTFPFVSLTNPLTIATIVACILETLMWYGLFVFDARFSGVVSTTKLLAFLNFLWMAPIGLLASLEIEQTGLPGSGLGMPGHHDHDICPGGGKKKTIFKELKSWLLPSTDE